MATVWILWQNITAGMVAAAMSSTFWLVVFIGGCFLWGLLRLNKSRQLERELEGLLKDANDATHSLLNALVSSHHDLATIRRNFEKWDSDMRDKLETLRRKGVCSAWQVDHFKVLTTYPPVEGLTNDHAHLRGMIAEKAHRLKNIARELDAKAQRLRPF